MITNKDEFANKPRFTRVERLEERIQKADILLKSLKNDMDKEGLQESSQIESILNEMKTIKQNLINQLKEEENQINKVINETNENSLLIINNEKIKLEVLLNKNEDKLKDKSNYIKKLEEEIRNQKLMIEQLNSKNNKLHETNSKQHETIELLKSKAFGYDIAKKFEIYKNKEGNVLQSSNRNMNEDPKLGYEIWERENVYDKVSGKLNDLTKEKQLWIGNLENNLDKIGVKSENKRNNLNNYEKKLNYNNHNSSSMANMMKKISPLLLNVNGK